MRPLRLALMLLALILASPAPQATARGRRDVVHVVKKGDTLGGIAAKYGVSVKTIRRANRLRGDLIRIGQKLKVPDAKRHRNEGKAKLVEHLVAPGETLSEIAKRYGSSVRDIRARNGIKRGGIIRIGQRLRVKATIAARQRRKFVYTIEPGDTLSEIAARFDMSVRDIQALNPRKNPRALRIGDRLTVYMDGPAARSVAVGRPQGGKLVNGEKLPPGPGYYRRNPARSWGTNETITELLRVIAAVRQKHPHVHDIVIEDISAKHGGHISPHKSHQSGRDVDMGVYFKGQPKSGPKRFLRASQHELDYEATWTLLVELVGTNRHQSRVSYIFWSYKGQKKMVEWAKKKGKPAKLIRRMFQYPRGRRAMRGVIRHVPGHDNHLHVRFKCPPDDKACI